MTWCIAMTDISNLRKTVEPKSNQLNADDLIGTTKTITVTAVKSGDSDQPVSVHYEGDNGKPYKPCKSMRRVLIYAWGDDGREWTGRSMTLYCDPEVKFGGVKVGGIRISHMSHIDKPIDLSLTVTRAKRQPYHVKPLADAPKPVPEKPSEYPQDKFDAAIGSMAGAIQSGKMTHSQVIAQCEKTAPLTEEQKAAINAITIPEEEEQF